MNTIVESAVVEKVAAVEQTAAQAKLDPWRGFHGQDWRAHTAVRDFINQNYTEYRGDDRFLAGPTEQTKRQMAVFDKLADFIATLGNVQRVDVLPVHKMGETKWKELDRPYRLSREGALRLPAKQPTPALTPRTTYAQLCPSCFSRSGCTISIQ